MTREPVHEECTCNPTVHGSHDGGDFLLVVTSIGNVAVLSSGSVNRDHSIVVVQLLGDFALLVICRNSLCRLVSLQCDCDT